jgi:hypothetical protein
MTYVPRRSSNSPTTAPSKSSTSSKTLIDQLATSSSSSHPQATANSPRTPPYPTLSRVDEDAIDPATYASGAPLVVKDYAKVDEDEESSESKSLEQDDIGGFGNAMPVPILQAPPRGRSAVPRSIPPPSVHDAYLSSIIPPLQTQSSPTRPPIPRSITAPDHSPANIRVASSSLLPSVFAPTPTRGTTGEHHDAKPIFEIFDAALSAPAGEMVKALKGHLDGVLRVQEEIGRMHLALEGLVGVPHDVGWPAEVGEGRGGLGFGKGKQRNTTRVAKEMEGRGQKGSESEDNDPLLLREKGVDEIMAKVYHYTRITLSPRS